ncbi:unnamed protein product [Mycena citricolor]|uniref:Vacuole protein n=1 Tax=Mycena citricolor TaxID=2018698 RepID=A0AAD2JUT6_9AGAR|nr:unnamed protein product [Mycena citricolor]CAK5275696.1 unnamed protein product [Mycena citricolor]
MCACGGPKWKREVVQDHKFDFISVADFRDNGFKMRMKYFFLFMIFFKSFAVYMSDIFTAVTMLTTTGWSNQIFNACTAQSSGCVFIPFNTGKWLFVGCIIFSFLLLGYESRKAKLIVASHDISYAFTNVLANNYYSLRSYDHFCFFDHISNSTKTSDDFAFFVFFVFKSWKRVLLADGPRQTINALTLYAVWETKHAKAGWDISAYFAGNTPSTSILLVTTLFTVIVFSGSLLLLVAACFCYVPLLCYIRGNLKEYCCHKVDKRIEHVIKKRQKQRLDENQKQALREARGDFSHLKNKKGVFTSKPLPQPTLPNLSVDDDLDDKASIYTRGPAPSTYTQDSYYYSDHKSNPPAMPAYNPYSNYQAPDAYAKYNPSQATLAQDEYQTQYGDESTTQLTSGAAPFAHGQHNIVRPGSAAPPNPYYAEPIDRAGSVAPYYAEPIDRAGSVAPYYAEPVNRTGSVAPPESYYGEAPQYSHSQYPTDRTGTPSQNFDPSDVYQGRAVPSPRPQQRAAPGAFTSPPSGLAYEDSDAYGGHPQHSQQQSWRSGPDPEQGRY